MAVIVKYVVERNGVEKMVSTSKKEADAYDKMLDVADGLTDFIGTSSLEIDDRLTEELALYLAQNSASLQVILKGGKLNATEENKEKAPKAKKSPKVTEGKEAD
ncbi:MULTISPECIES: YebG family protein [unclassified Moritella]|uniref:YebG family protein n=1 Tax=unclassified Moritella TaxID=2637987 RepID=UPI001BADC452|nr:MULTISPECIES: YebG family protein [unclassified Moritella]QUM85164.1 YebG family protein [Moritella sp. 28]QUM89393.1 YebG family protein [Moritella sp. 36]